MATKSKYSLLQIGLHWLIVVLIAAAWFLGDGMNRALDARLEAGTTGTEGNTLHVWTGGAVFVLVLIRIVVRLVQGAPAPVPGLPDWQETAGKLGHLALYVLMVLVPALGATAWYGHIDAAGLLHTLAVDALVIVILGHAAMAFYHHYVLKDATLRRMLGRS